MRPPITVGTPAQTSWGSNQVLRLFEFPVISTGSHDIQISGSPGLFWRLYAPGSNTSWRPRSSATLEANGAVGGPAVSTGTLGSGFHCLIVYKNSGVAAPSPADLTISVCRNQTSTLALGNGNPANVTQACRDFSMTPVGGEWNVVGISGGATWQVNMGTGHSNVGGNLANFVLANGHDGTITPASGIFIRTSSSGTGTAIADDATPIAVGRGVDTSMPSGVPMRLYEFDITSAGSYTIDVAGEANDPLFWRLYAPTGNARWIDRGDSSANRNVGGGSVTANLSTGHHALIVYRNGGPPAASTAFTITVCPVTTILNLSTTGTNVTDSCRRISHTPSAGSWNAVSVTGADDWDISMGPIRSNLSGSLNDYLVANGHNGSISPLNGIISRQSGSGTGRASSSAISVIPVGTASARSWSSTRSIRLFQFNITTPGSYDVSARPLSGLANSDLFWRLYDPGTDSAWRPRSSSITGASIGLTRTVTLGSGDHCIVVYRNGAVGVSGNFEVLVTPTPNPVPSLSTISPSTRAVGSGSFTLTCNGSQFVTGSSVRIDGSAIPTTFVSPSRLSATVPASLQATAANLIVTVVNPGPGGGTSANRILSIENPAPFITSITPSSRTVPSNTFSLSVDGSGFVPASIVRWNGTPSRRTT